jgi:hypothetical protein
MSYVQNRQTVQRNTPNVNEVRSLFNAGQSGFHVHHSMIPRCKKLTDHSTFNLKKQGVYSCGILGIQEPFDIKWQSGLSRKSKLDL